MTKRKRTAEKVADATGWAISGSMTAAVIFGGPRAIGIVAAVSAAVIAVSIVVALREVRRQK